VKHDEELRAALAAGAAAITTVCALFAGGAAAIPRIADLCVLAAAIAVLCAAVFFYVHWHVAGDPSMAWLVIVAGAYSLQKLNWYALDVGGSTSADSAWAYVFQIGVALALGTLLVRGNRLPVRGDPLAVGLLLGLAVIVARIAVLAIPAPALSTVGFVAVVAALGVVGLWNAARLLHSSVLTEDLRHRIALALVFLTVGQVSAAPGAPYAVLVLSSVVNVFGGALLITTAVTRARAAVSDEASALQVLRVRLESSQEDHHDDEARLHEIRATLAGISTATELIQYAEVSPARRTQLQEMAISELHRLERLVGATPVTPPEPTELDATLRPIIVRHQAAGVPVSWQPSGTVVIARPDDVAEIVNILLSNAVRHGGGGPVHVGVHTDGDTVAVSVTDSGRGIDPALQPHLFTWGVRGSDSPGRGIGLAAAHKLASDLGGGLALARDTARGARFILSLPAPVTATPQELSR